MNAMEPLLKEIGSRLAKRNYLLATAESCTGGLLGYYLTVLPGASDFYLGGLIAYSNHLKKNLLVVPQEILDTYGAVSKQTVKAMAKGIRISFAGSLDIRQIIGLSISGIAGPSGGTPEKPVGTVCIGLSIKNTEMAYCYQFDGSRNDIRSESVQRALEILECKTEYIPVYN